MSFSYRIFCSVSLVLVCLIFAGIFSVTEASAESIAKAHETSKHKNTGEKKTDPVPMAEILAAKPQASKPEAEAAVSPSSFEESLKVEATSLKVEAADDTLGTKIRGLMGTPYRFGGDGKGGLDCSAFVKKVFASLSIFLPRTAREQYALGKVVPAKELRKGDLLFFRTYAKYASHVGIYLGNKLMVHASSRDRSVVVSNVDTPYYNSRYLGARRIGDDSKQESLPPEIVELASSL